MSNLGTPKDHEFNKTPVYAEGWRDALKPEKARHEWSARSGAELFDAGSPRCGCSLPHCPSCGEHTQAGVKCCPPRFQVKPASEMREGEPCRRYTQEDLNADIVRRDQEWLRANDDNFALLNQACAKWGDRTHHAMVAAMVDTHSPEWQAFQARRATEAPGWWSRVQEWSAAATGRVTQDYGIMRTWACWDCGAEFVSKEGDRCSACVAQDERPTDAEIVAVYTWEMGAVEDILAGRPQRAMPEGVAVCVGGWTLRSHTITREQFAPAWSRELQRMQGEAREKERQRVVCEGTLAEDY